MIIIIIRTHFLAGFETSSSALSYTLYELSLNEEIQEKTRREINKVLEDFNGEVTYEAINSMDYVGQVINESMR